MLVARCLDCFSCRLAKVHAVDHMSGLDQGSHLKKSLFFVEAAYRICLVGLGVSVCWCSGSVNDSYTWDNDVHEHTRMTHALHSMHIWAILAPLSWTKTLHVSSLFDPQTITVDDICTPCKPYVMHHKVKTAPAVLQEKTMGGHHLTNKH
jgi:hypothetical protein